MKRPRIVSAIIRVSSNMRKINTRRKVEFEDTVIMLQLNSDYSAQRSRRES